MKFFIPGSFSPAEVSMEFRLPGFHYVVDSCRLSRHCILLLGFKLSFSEVCNIIIFEVEYIYSSQIM